MSYKTVIVYGELQSRNSANGLRHAEIKLANPNVNLDVLKVGMEIRLP